MKEWLKRHWLGFSVIIALLLGLWFLEIFPDPYYHEEHVNLYTWIWRELDELLHGEKE